MTLKNKATPASTKSVGLAWGINLIAGFFRFGKGLTVLPKNESAPNLY